MLRRTLVLIAVLTATVAVPTLAAAHQSEGRLDGVLQTRARGSKGTSRVIVQTEAGVSADALIRSVHGVPGRRLALGGQVARIPDSALRELAQRPGVLAVSLDRPVIGTMERTSAAIGATWVRENFGVDGAGVGVALIDSGVVSWHDDLGPDRVTHFSDFVEFQPVPYDDYGHGTHVAGIIAGSGYDSNGARRGIAPGASLVVLKVLDEDGNGYISNVIAALEYAVENRARFNIRVVNLSVAAGVYESYTTDPLTLAAKRAVEAGIVVVTAAGNYGKSPKGAAQYGGITAPGNAPWVITVGAASHNGTASRADDAVAAFSSRGPSYIDYAAKPDVVAPGVGIESLADASSFLFASHPAARLWGTVDTATPPYLSLSGTSMAAPVVTGTVALMLQANPALTPNLVKAILQYTAEHRAKYDDLTQGAGFLNARGAVQLAKHLGGDRTALSASKDPTPWNAHINWGNHRIGGGMLKPDANAWRTDVTWGADSTIEGDHIVWGTIPAGRDAANIVWGSIDEEDNIVWGTACDGAVCGSVVWGTGCDPLNASCGEVVWRAAKPVSTATSRATGARRRSE